MRRLTQVLALFVVTVSPASAEQKFDLAEHCPALSYMAEMTYGLLERKQSQAEAISILTDYYTVEQPEYVGVVPQIVEGVYRTYKPELSIDQHIALFRKNCK